ncbi:NAD(P)/FAD-dependent oxidoreductase [Arthrobacter sp. Marseille-P9274]|uniref:flavin-containing monooxygenase n=1 Tax=Arthrobacter sp. Marseille-P9274 TaxID=2866572 RepID=UPI0021C78C44|nr:NAD(P)/FAD-dependent oxidoreductase [Arthrobacter sp. Marseille-P9274]
MMERVREVDAVIVGAGFSGLYMLHKLRDQGLSAVVFEKGDGVGGTWYWNRYPGARCDVESPYYSYSFDPELEQEWEWTERYPAQPELMRYLNFVADRYDLRRDLELETTVTAAEYDGGTNRWRVSTSSARGDEVTQAQFCIMATGCLSTSRIPDFRGLESFSGEVYHTGAWPHEDVDFTGKRVGVVGTGSSGIQSIPVIAAQAEQLTVFQRTPNFSVPAKNGPLDQEFWQDVKANYRRIREDAKHTPTGLPFPPGADAALEAAPEERQRVFDEHWTLGGFRLAQCFSDLAVSNEANETVAEYIRTKIDEIVEDPETARLLKPYDHPVGTKRICVDTEYYATYNRPNVQLVDVRKAPIEEITPAGLRTAEQEYEFDAIVFATGFDAMTGALLAIDIRGRDGVALRDKWEAGPRAYLGVSMAGFPNLFTVTGPGSPSVLSNMVTSIEQHVDWIARHIEYLDANGLQSSEPLAEAEDAWVEHVNALADMTLFPQANSWYLGANVPGKPRVFMPYVGGVGAYRAKCDEVAAKAYEGFALA